MKNIIALNCLLVLFFITACNEKENTKTLFSKITEDESGITFRNLLKEEDPQFNIIFYPYFYNGGGVAVGDINNDGLQDIFFTGNMVKNRLFINEGNLSFKDITTTSHVAEKEGWCTGATMVDINEDGWQDIYVCRSALSNESYRKNLLFINNKDLTFTERAAEYGLDDAGYSTQASFFDYDKDGDLDMFLINQSTPEYSRGGKDYLQLRNQAPNPQLENKLFRNDQGHFTNVTKDAGIQSNLFTFSLGISTADVDLDGWPDIYVANDFKEGDYLYINNKNGTFTNRYDEKLDHSSLYSMGVDIADYNNDLLPDVMVLDMLAEGNHAQKMHMGGDNFNQYNYLFSNGMQHQYMKNSLQKNNGDGTFSEIGQLAGVSNTDWSWSPLFADYDNDGLRDLFISNGYKRDNTDIQFVVYSMDQSLRLQKGGDAVDVAEYISHMPGIHLPNYIYRNKGNDAFENKIKDWGFDHNTFSHGATYADLDNDGDLDLITNNTDDYAGIYRNNSESLPNANFLTIELKGTKSNAIGIGAKVYAYGKQGAQYIEQNPVRGYQASASALLHLGLGAQEALDSVVVVWPNEYKQVLHEVKANQRLVLDIKNASVTNHSKVSPQPLMRKNDQVLTFTHKENTENDFLKQFLLPYFLSHNGPCMAKGDVNGDGLVDVYIGGAKDQAGQLFIQKKGGKFESSNTNSVFLTNAISEDTDAIFVDADGDKDLDLYVVSGGYEFEEQAPALQDRLYLNNGKGSFSKAINKLPAYTANKTIVRAADVDGDGDIDLFVGGGVPSGKYPLANKSKIWINTGKGSFEEGKQYDSMLNKLEVVSDAAWMDVNNDKKKDLIVISSWHAPQVFIRSGMSFSDQSNKYIDQSLSGMWNTLLAKDLDNDGDEDLVLGNFGNNAQLKVTKEHPMELYYSDIDGNGSIDPIITHYIGDKPHPLIARDDLIGQVPVLKKKFDNYEKYADATIQEILSPEQLSKSVKRSVQSLETMVLMNTGKGFEKRSLPIEAQYASVHTISASDVNHDGFDDLLLHGNNAYTRISLARDDASHGMLFLGDGKGNFKYVPQNISGLHVRGDVRSSMVIGNKVVFGVNNGTVEVYEY